MGQEVEMRSAKKDEPWSEWFIETVPEPLFNVVQSLTSRDATLTMTYKNGFRDEFRPVGA